MSPFMLCTQMEHKNGGFMQVELYMALLRSTSMAASTLVQGIVCLPSTVTPGPPSGISQLVVLLALALQSHTMAPYTSEPLIIRSMQSVRLAERSGVTKLVGPLDP